MFTVVLLTLVDVGGCFFLVLVFCFCSSLVRPQYGWCIGLVLVLWSLSTQLHLAVLDLNAVGHFSGSSLMLSDLFWMVLPGFTAFLLDFT